ncbi:MAG: UDP-N-acetylmuramoyl-tripeptide--D-alanyl-D-alanine ligase [Spirosomataceae bacterium]
MLSIAHLYDLFLKSTGVSTDTRKITKGSLFFALKGENFNANEFALKALEKGAGYAVIDEEKYNTDERCLLVNDVLYTLQKLANFHRNHLTIPIIGLTGSNGKTTNKELINSILSRKYNCYATEGNLNNHIGVPLSLLKINSNHEIAVIEMGANHQGEIRLLSGISEPTHGFITNIGKAHLEGFGGMVGVRKGKGELFDFLSEFGGTIFVNENDEMLGHMHAERPFKETVFYGKSSEYLEMISASPVIQLTVNNSQHLTSNQKLIPIAIGTHLSGLYNFVNMQTAFAVGRYFEVSSEDCLAAISEYNPDNNRSQIVEKGTNTLYMDAYNANPSSMEASIQNFINLETDKQKVVILGDMFELGDATEAEHEALGELVKKGKFSTVVLFGNHISAALKYLPQAYYFNEKFSLHLWLNDKKLTDSVVLVKGSRGVKLESVVDFL